MPCPGEGCGSFGDGMGRWWHYIHGTHMLAMVKAVHLKCIVCLAHTFYLEMKDALGLSLGPPLALSSPPGMLSSFRWDPCLRPASIWLPTKSRLPVCCVRSWGREMRNSTYASIAHLVEQKSVVQDIFTSMTILHREVELSINWGMPPCHEFLFANQKIS